MSPRSVSQMNQTTLASLLRRLHATGPEGFEGLILGLIEDLTGYPMHLARSGDQNGRDMLTEAVTTVPHLDSWVLVASRTVSDQLYTSIERAARELRIEVARSCCGALWIYGDALRGRGASRRRRSWGGHMAWQTGSGWP